MSKEPAIPRCRDNRFHTMYCVMGSGASRSRGDAGVKRSLREGVESAGAAHDPARHLEHEQPGLQFGSLHARRSGEFVEVSRAFHQGISHGVAAGGLRIPPGGRLVGDAERFEEYLKSGYGRRFLKSMLKDYLCLCNREIS